MKILVLLKKEKRTIIDQLKGTEDIEEVANVLKPFRQRSIFLEIIDELLNEISELEGEKKQLIARLIPEEEVEIL